MYTYSKKNKIGPGSLIFLALFLLAAAGLVYLAFTDKGLFWDYMPIACITIVVLSLIFAIFNLVRRNGIGFVFILFLLAAIAGIVMSSLFGPFALHLVGQRSFEEGNYSQAIASLETVVEEYPSSRYWDSALTMLPFAYFNDGNCRQAIEYLDQGIDIGLLDSNLETKTIYVKCYLSLADHYFGQNDYTAAATNYLAAVNLYRDLKENHPDTDEAFIADYQIPELMFKAASAYKQSGNREKSNEILNNLVEQYAQSEYGQKAEELLFSNYVNNALVLKQDRDYEAAIRELIKVKEWFNLPQDAFRVDHYRQVILSDIPLFYLEQEALRFYNQKQYQESAYIYEAILEYYPQSAADNTPYLVQSKINYFASINYYPLAISGEPSGRYSEEISVLEIENRANYDATLYLAGPENLMVNIQPGTTMEIEMAPGTYKGAVEFSLRQSIPLWGNISLEPGRKQILPVEP